MRALYQDRLYEWVADGLRCETVQQPAYVGHELRAISLRHRAQRTRVTGLRHDTAAAAAALGCAQRLRWRRDQTAIASLTRTHDQIAARLERSENTLRGIEAELREATGMHQAWQEWEHASPAVHRPVRRCLGAPGRRGPARTNSPRRPRCPPSTTPPQHVRHPLLRHAGTRPGRTGGR